MKKVSFTVDGQKLVGTLFYPKLLKEKNKVILFIHGWDSSQKRDILRAQALVKLGFICLTFELRSHGESEGDRESLSREDYMQDVTAAYDLLKAQKGVDEENISIVGSSFGSYLACLLTAKRKVAFLALRVPANYMDEGFTEPHVKYAATKSMVAWRQNPLPFKGSRSLLALHKFPKEVLIIESEFDELVPQPTIQNYINAVKDKSKLTHVAMLGAGHSIHDEKLQQEYIQILFDWFTNKS